MKKKIFNTFFVLLVFMGLFCGVGYAEPVREIIGTAVTGNRPPGVGAACFGSTLNGTIDASRIAYDSSRDLFYVVRHTTNSTLTVISASTFAKVNTSTITPCGSLWTANSIFYDSGNDKLFVACNSSVTADFVRVLTPGTNPSLGSSITLPITGGTLGEMVLVTSSGELWLSNWNIDITRINPVTEAIIGTIPISETIRDLEYVPSVNKVFGDNPGTSFSGNAFVIDPVTFSITQLNLNGDFTSEVVYDSVSDRVFIFKHGFDPLGVWIVNPNNNNVEAFSSAPLQGGQFLWNVDGGAVSVPFMPGGEVWISGGDGNNNRDRISRFSSSNFAFLGSFVCNAGSNTYKMATHISGRVFATLGTAVKRAEQQ